MTRTITRPEALEALRKAVEEKGADYRYVAPGGSCVYAHEGKTSCIVGHAMHQFGVPVEDMENVYGVVSGFAFSKLLRRHDIKIAPDALRAFKWAQMVQDMGQPWGEALAEAERS